MARTCRPRDLGPWPDLSFEVPVYRRCRFVGKNMEDRSRNRAGGRCSSRGDGDHHHGGSRCAYYLLLRSHHVVDSLARTTAGLPEARILRCGNIPKARTLYKATSQVLLGSLSALLPSTPKAPGSQCRQSTRLSDRAPSNEF